MRTRQWLIGSIAVVVGLMLWAGTLHAQSGYDLSWFSVDGGGGVSSGGAYSLRGIAGQADAGQLSGGSYTLTGGVLAVQDAGPIGPAPKPQIFMPSLQKQP